MKKTILLVIALLLSFGLVWLGCDKGPSQVSGPGVETHVGKGVPNQNAIDRVMAIQNLHSRALLHMPGVVGIATTLGYDGSPIIVVLTETPDVKGVPNELDGVPVGIVVSGKFKAFGKPTKPSPVAPVAPTDRFARPVPIGVSTGHPDITAGTIGARLKNGNGQVFALSNNHVYANENLAKTGDIVIQPGAYDGGVAPSDEIGTLYKFAEIKFDGSANIVDAAIALSSTGLLGNATPSNGYGVPKSTPMEAFINQQVMKYGRTTGQTKGKVYAINATVNVGYSTGIALFQKQIIITPGTFSAGGDSGSLIVSAEKGANNRKPVALLFAGSNLYTIANPIGEVLNSFGVSIDGD